MSNQNGMGHITLIICILVIIVAIVGIVNFVKILLNEEKNQSFETDMLLIQGKVKVMSKEANIQKNDELLKGKKIRENLENEEIKKLLEKNIISEGEENFDKYYYLEQSDIDEMGLGSIELKEGFYIVNYTSYEIIYTVGIEIENNVLYKLSDIQNIEKNMMIKNEETEQQEEGKDENKEESQEKTENEEDIENNETKVEGEE